MIQWPPKAFLLITGRVTRKNRALIEDAARQLAMRGAEQRRKSWTEKRNAVAQQLRAEKGLPPHPALSSRAN